MPDPTGRVAAVTGGSEGSGYGVTHTLLSKNISKVKCQQGGRCWRDEGGDGGTNSVRDGQEFKKRAPQAEKQGHAEASGTKRKEPSDDSTAFPTPPPRPQAHPVHSQAVNVEFNYVLNRRTIFWEDSDFNGGPFPTVCFSNLQ